MKQVTNTLLALVLIGGLTFAVLATYNRIFVEGDYQVEYAVNCDPEMTSCFSKEVCDEVTGECTTEYFALMSRSSSLLKKACGSDLNSCLASQQCLAEEFNCSITYCDPAVDVCTYLEGIEAADVSP